MPDESQTQEHRIAFWGGEPAFPGGPPPWPRNDPSVRAALEEVYASGDWGRYDGRFLRELELEAARYFGVKHSLACSSGTVAMELALRGLRIGPGDDILIAGYDFAGNFRAIEAVGANPVLVDIAPNSWKLDPVQVRPHIGSSTKAVIVSHLHGELAAMEQWRAIADATGVKIVEDAAQCPGAMIEGRRAGSWGDVAVLSFGGSKLLTAGRGGMVLTDDAAVTQRIVVASQRGNNAHPLSELQAAVLLPQLQMLDQLNSMRRLRAMQLQNRLQGLELISPPLNCDERNAVATFRLGYLLPENADRDRIASAMRAEGIALDPGFRGFVRKRSSQCRIVGDLRHSQIASSQTLLLHHAALLEDEATITRLANAVQCVLHALTPDDA